MKRRFSNTVLDDFVTLEVESSFRVFTLFFLKETFWGFFYFLIELGLQHLSEVGNT